MSGYEPTDPKHPDWADLAADKADTERKLMKEQAPEWRGVYPGMCVDPEVCRGFSHCPRNYSCCE